MAETEKVIQYEDEALPNHSNAALIVGVTRIVGNNLVEICLSHTWKVNGVVCHPDPHGMRIVQPITSAVAYLT